MKARFVFALLCLCSSAAFAQVLWSEDCSSDRGPVRTGQAIGNPAAISSATTITIDNFSKLVYPKGTDPNNRPSKISPKGLLTGEGVLYRIDNIELRGQSNCKDSIAVDLGRFGEFNTQPEILALIPSAACTSGPMKTATDATRDNYTNHLSVWGSSWADFEKNCGDGGDNNPKSLSAVGYLFWDDSDGVSAPVPRLAPLIALFVTADGPSSGGGGGGGTPVTIPDVQIGTSADFDATQPLSLLNAQSMSIPLHVYSLTGFSSDIFLAATSDSPENNDFHVSVTPGTLDKPGVGDATLKIEAGPMALPRDYIVTVSATTNEQTPRSFFTYYLITLNCDPPMILGIDQPKSLSVTRGTTTTLKVKPTGSGPFVYQWYNGYPGMTWSPVAGATSSTFTTPAINDESTFWVRISNACGTADSGAATISPR